jgi:hypothetical protein
LVVTVLDTGFFAYNPVYQRPLFDLMLLQSILVSLAETEVRNVVDFDPMEARIKVLDKAKAIGLLDMMEEKKGALAELVTAVHSLRNLSREQRLSATEAVEEFGRRSVVAQVTRAGVLAKDVVAVGAPESVERMQQLDEISKGKATPAWRDNAMKVARGRLLHLSVQTKSANRDEEKQLSQLAIARSRFDPTKQTQAAAKGGIWLSYSPNNAITLEVRILCESVQL